MNDDVSASRLQPTRNRQSFEIQVAEA